MPRDTDEDLYKRFFGAEGSELQDNWANYRHKYACTGIGIQSSRFFHVISPGMGMDKVHVGNGMGMKMIINNGG